MSLSKVPRKCRHAVADDLPAHLTCNTLSLCDGVSLALLERHRGRLNYFLAAALRSFSAVWLFVVARKLHNSRRDSPCVLQRQRGRGAWTRARQTFPAPPRTPLLLPLSMTSTTTDTTATPLLPPKRLHRCHRRRQRLAKFQARELPRHCQLAVTRPVQPLPLLPPPPPHQTALWTLTMQRSAVVLRMLRRRLPATGSVLPFKSRLCRHRHLKPAVAPLRTAPRRPRQVPSQRVPVAWR